MRYAKIQIVMVFSTYRNRREYDLRVVARNGRVVAYGNQGYTSRRDAVRGAATLRRVIREAFVEGARA